jgi:hypothetical protein
MLIAPYVPLAKQTVEPADALARSDAALETELAVTVQAGVGAALTPTTVEPPGAAAAATVGVWLEVAWFEPPVLLAVTTTRMVSLTSEPCSM